MTAPTAPQGYAQQMPTGAAADPFSAARPAFTGQVGPALRCIGERLVVIVPKQILRDEPNPFYKAEQPVSYSNSPTRNRMVCDLVLVSGQPFMYGGNNSDIPDTQGPFPVPGVISNYEIIKTSVVNSVDPTTVGGGAVIGYLYKTKTANNNTAWNFGKTPEAGSPERNFAAQVFQAYQAGQLPTHVPTAPVANPVQPAYTMPVGQQAPYIQSYGQGGPAAQVAQPTMGQYAQMPPSQSPQFNQTVPGTFNPMGPQAVPAPPSTPAPQGAPQWPQGMQPGQMAPMQQQAPALGAPYAQPDPWAAQNTPAQPVSAPQAPAQDWTLSIQPPAGYEAVWPTWTAAQREQVARQLGLVPQQPGQPQAQPAQAQYGQGPTGY